MRHYLSLQTHIQSTYFNMYLHVYTYTVTNLNPQRCASSLLFIPDIGPLIKTSESSNPLTVTISVGVVLGGASLRRVLWKAGKDEITLRILIVDWGGGGGEEGERARGEREGEK